MLRAVLAHRYPDSTTIRAPWIIAPVEEAIRTPQFIADRAAFVADLVRTGKVNRSRAWDIADVAVREDLHEEGAPGPGAAGVMLTEDDALTSVAQSSVGAIGLMPIHAPAWRGREKWFGGNLRNDSTNLKYGIYILGVSGPHEVARDREHRGELAECAVALQRVRCGDQHSPLSRRIPTSCVGTCWSPRSTAALAATSTRVWRLLCGWLNRDTMP